MRSPGCARNPALSTERPSPAGTTGSPTLTVSAIAGTNDGGVFLYAFDLMELDGEDLRREPLEERKATLASVIARAALGLRLNEYIEHDGPTVFAHACKLRLEGIVSKRRNSSYSSGRSPHWIKSKNPDAPAVKREVEEDWGRWPSANARRLGHACASLRSVAPKLA